MNTENFKPLKNISLKFIEKKQIEILFAYEPSEKEIFENFDIDVYEDQEVFKKYAWRITEELTEALEDTEHEQHYKEEIIDAFNFLIELYNLYGWSIFSLSKIEIYPDANATIKDRKLAVLNVVKQLGLTCNLLKNRKWRQSQYLVDLYIFEERFRKVWDDFLRLLEVSNISKEELFDQWSLKWKVNNFRLKTQY